MIKYPTYTCGLCQALESASSASCKTPATFIDSICHFYLLHQTISRKKAKNPEIRFKSQQIILHCLGLHTQNPGLREVDLEASPKRGSDKINMLKQGRKTQEENKLYCTAWTHKWIPALREVDLEPNAERGANRTDALVSLYWTSRSLHPKEPPNQVSHKSIKVDPIRSSQTWKKV